MAILKVFILELIQHLRQQEIARGVRRKIALCKFICSKLFTRIIRVFKKNTLNFISTLLFLANSKANPPMKKLPPTTFHIPPKRINPANARHPASNRNHWR
jgi:hypothetical protein